MCEDTQPMASTTPVKMVYFDRLHTQWLESVEVMEVV